MTKSARSYHVLHLDFTFDVAGDYHQNFADAVNRQLESFCAQYNLQFDINERDCCVSFAKAANAVKAKGGKLYVLIDEYDRFANRLVVERFEQYDTNASDQRIVRASSSICSLLETLKAIHGVEVRSFITGIMPLAIPDSGYNVAKDLTYDHHFASLVGFRERDLKRALELVPQLSAEQRRGTLEMMRRHYNGYLFFGSEEPLYNSTISLFLLDHLAQGTCDIDELLALDAARDPKLVYELSDDNVSLSPSVVALARSVPVGERVVASLMGESVPLDGGWLLTDLSVDGLLSAAAATRESQREVQALLYYQGVVTYADREFNSLKLPNEMIRRAMLALFARAR